MRARNDPDRPVGWDEKTPVPLAADVLTAEETAEYLAAVQAGVGLALAARGVGKTATQLRRLRRRDGDFDAKVRAAMQDAQDLYVDRLRAQARNRALMEQSDRMLEVELATHADGYEHLRRDRLKVDARLEHAIVLPPDALARLTDEQVGQLRELVSAMEGEVVDGTAEEITDTDAA